jgi:hypothetical protein
MRTVEALLADVLGDHHPDQVAARAIGGRVQGVVSALARGSAARVSLGHRVAVQWAFRQQMPPPDVQPPLPHQPPPGSQPPVVQPQPVLPPGGQPMPGQPPAGLPAAVPPASVVPSVPDALLRPFVTQFSDMAELTQRVEVLVIEADIRLLEKVGPPGMPFGQAGPVEMRPRACGRARPQTRCCKVR